MKASRKFSSSSGSTAPPRHDRVTAALTGWIPLAFLEAINTGHPGSISTIHANSPVLALDRLSLMVMRTGTRLTRADVLEYAARTIDLIVQVGRDDGRRGVEEVFMPALALQSRELV